MYEGDQELDLERVCEREREREGEGEQSHKEKTVNYKQVKSDGARKY